MFVPRQALTGRYPTTEIYRNGEECKYFHMASEEARSGSEMILTAYGQPLVAVSSFKYLGRIL